MEEVSGEGGGGGSGGGEVPRASLAVRRSAQLPKLKDLARKRPESYEEENGGDRDLEFEYGDCDPSFGQELAELYAYSELPDFLLNAAAFAQYHNGKAWWDVSEEQRRNVVFSLLNDMDSADQQTRNSAVRATLYLLQGNFKDHTTEREVLWSGVRNAYLLVEAGSLGVLCGVLAREMETAEEEDERISNEKREAALAEQKAEVRVGGRPSWAQPSLQTKRSGSVTIHDNEELRVVLSALYHLVESVRREGLGELGAVTALTEAEHTRYGNLRREFRESVGDAVVGTTPLPVLLFQMTIKFCAGTVASFPMRKVLLLLWKLLLTWLGGWETLRREKVEARKLAGLPPQEDTLLIARHMRAANPPTVPGIPGLVAGGDESNARRNRPPLAKRQVACEGGSSEDDDSGTETDEAPPPVPEEKPSRGGEETPRPSSPTPSNASVASSRSGTFPKASLSLAFAKSLPWAPKIRGVEVEAYLEAERLKFLGFQLPGDSTTTAGLPEPIRQSLKSLQKHVYVSLGETQIQREEELNKYRFSQKEEVPETPMEQLYRQLLPEIPQHMIALLKIILSAQPSSRGKTDAMNILADVLTGEVEPGLLSNSNTQGSLSGDEGEEGVARKGGEDSVQARLWAITALDVARHKELIVKAASALLLLLLKHARLSHIYQFEHIAQHLVFANCIPLILKFFDGNILGFVQSKAELAELDFPACVLGGPSHHCHWPPNLPTTRLEIYKAPDCPAGYFLWRNLFSSINLLRILNKLTKWKHARTMMLVVFKSAPILKRTLKIKVGISSINLLRILNKLTKWKHARTMMLVVFKFAPILKRTLKIKIGISSINLLRILNKLTSGSTPGQ